MENERNFCFAYARFPQRLRRARYSQDMQIRGNKRNLGCKMQTTSFFYIYGDTGFERK